jgi:hypothetical protein
VLVLLVLIPIATLLRSVRVVHHRIGHLQNEYKKSTLLIMFTKLFERRMQIYLVVGGQRGDVRIVGW